MPEEDSLRRPLLHSIAIVKAFVLSMRLTILLARIVIIATISS